MLQAIRPLLIAVFTSGSVLVGAVAAKSPSPADLAAFQEASTSVEVKIFDAEVEKMRLLQELSRNSTTTSTSTTSTSTTTTTTVPTTEQLLQAYSMREEILEPEELRELLELTGFEGDNLRTAWALVMRESRGKPKAFNGNLETGDSSYGLFQINMLGYLGRHRAELYELDEYEDLFDPVTNARVAFEMSSEGTNFGPWCLGPHAYNGCRVGDYPYWLTQFPEEVSKEWQTVSVTPNTRLMR